MDDKELLEKLTEALDQKLDQHTADMKTILETKIIKPLDYLLKTYHPDL